MWAFDGESYHSRVILIGNLVINIETPGDAKTVHTHVNECADGYMARDVALAITRVDEHKGLTLDGDVLVADLDTNLEWLVKAYKNQSPLLDEKIRRIIRSIQMSGRPLGGKAELE